ncbi:translation initiation factor eIF-2B subunit gamma [Wyeomyia smithii]|uniref:translation initiation factor eIF-2B subunit gamma n=1 Tax=Wyeomyia smithii TaxID=174621 RepID=UPI002467DC8E|nr:translation initiation factor eIF-2B subunit gamma [Wyeomyia smithii]
MVAPEFQAIVLAAGKGSRLTEVLEERPKCLLPIGIYPLIWYTLKMLQTHGFTEAIVLVLENEKIEIQQRLEKTQLKLKIDFCSISGDSDVGTADALRQIVERIKTDFVLLSCDTIMEFSLYHVLKSFRKHNATIVSLLVHSDDQDFVIPGPKMKNKLELDLFGICPTSKRLVFMGSASDFENIFKLPGHLLRQHESVELCSGLLDAHVYVMKKWMIDYIEASSNISSLKGELLPYILKRQLYTSLNSQQTQMDKAISEINMITKSNDIFRLISNSEIDKKMSDSSIFNQEPPFGNNLLGCYAVTAPKNTFGVRVNTLSAFYLANRQIYNVFSSIVDSPVTTLIAPNCDINSNQVSKTAVGEQTVIHEKTSITSSTIGANCVIKPKVLILTSILMDNVIVEESVVIENCILSDNSIIKSGSILRNCLIGANYIVSQNSQKDFVHLSNSKDFMEI